MKVSNLTKLSVVLRSDILVDEGTEDPNTTISETFFKSLSRAISVLHYSLRQYSQYTVIGRTALVTSQIQGK